MNERAPEFVWSDAFKAKDLGIINYTDATGQTRQVDPDATIKLGIEVQHYAAPLTDDDSTLVADLEAYLAEQDD